MAATAKLAVPKLLFARTPAEVTKASDTRLKRARSILKKIVAVKEPRTVENTLVPFDELLVHVTETGLQGDLVLNTHPEAAMREVADKAYQAARSLESELSLHRPLYDAIAALDVTSADEETKFAMFKILREFRRSGVDRDEATRAKVQALRDEITAIGSEFDKTIRDDVRTIHVAREELAGLPEDFVAAHPPGPDGTIALTTNYPDALPLLQYGADHDARRRMMWEFRNRGHPKNLDVLERLIAKRHELATLLGYAHWADYVTEDKMIGSAHAAADFIRRVTDTADARSREDYAMFLARKRKDVPEAKDLDPWDRGYYEEVVRTEQYAFDSRDLRPYFPFARVRDGLFETTGRLFGVRYRRVKEAPVWHPSVEVFDLYDGRTRLGRFFLDLHPREGKFTHAAAFPITVGIADRQLPQAALVCNFPDPVTGPALMTADDVITFFHEFGHLIHFILAGRVHWSKNAPGEVEWDFVEAPSQMLEEWARDPATLQTFARHHETGEPIPAALVDRMKRADAVGRGLDARRQMFLAAFSLGCYDRDPAGIDTTALAKETNAKYDLVPWFEGTHLQCGFGHLNGYSAIYYTYMWSLVIAKDLFRAFLERPTILDREQAAKYRTMILESGSVRPAADLVRAYLGREPSFEAFAAWLREAA